MSVITEVASIARVVPPIGIFGDYDVDGGTGTATLARYLRAIGADAVTVNAYLGPTTIEPYLDAGLGVFVLVRTSNPDSDAVQSSELSSGGTVAESMACLVRKSGTSRMGVEGMSDLGAVVGLTKSADGQALRAGVCSGWLGQPDV